MNVGSVQTTVAETRSVKIQLAVTVVPAIQDTEETVFLVLVGILFSLSLLCVSPAIVCNMHAAST